MQLSLPIVFFTIKYFFQCAFCTDFGPLWPSAHATVQLAPTITNATRLTYITRMVINLGLKISNKKNDKH